MRLLVAGLRQRKVLREKNSAGSDLYRLHASKCAERKFRLVQLLTSCVLCVIPRILFQLQHNTRTELYRQRNQDCAHTLTKIIRIQHVKICTAFQVHAMSSPETMYMLAASVTTFVALRWIELRVATSDTGTCATTYYRCDQASQGLRVDNLYLRCGSSHGTKSYSACPLKRFKDSVNQEEVPSLDEGAASIPEEAFLAPV